MTNKTLVFAWEFGGGYGHVLGFSPIAETLVKQEWEIASCVKNPVLAKQLLPEQIGCRAIPSITRQRQTEETISYAEILLNNGFHDIAALKKRVIEWIQYFEFIKPDVVLLDYAPTAIIACRILGLPTALIGTGFFSPPRAYPIPSMIEGISNDNQRLLQSEHRLLENINQVLAHFDQPKLAKLYHLYDFIKEDFLCTTPELDHYPIRPQAEYWGPRFANDQSTPAVWSKLASIKVFLYLRENYTHLNAIFDVLKNSRYESVAHIPNYEHSVIDESNIHFSPSPVSIDSVIEQADIIICHAGHGLVSGALLAGKKMLLLPNQLEQRILAQNMARRGLAYWVSTQDEDIDFAHTLQDVYNNTQLEANLEQIRNAYSGYEHQEQIESICDALNDLIEDHEE